MVNSPNFCNSTTTGRVSYVLFLEDSLDAKPSPSSDSRNSTPEPKTAFKDKKEALEAFKELLKEKVRN